MLGLFILGWNLLRANLRRRRRKDPWWAYSRMYMFILPLFFWPFTTNSQTANNIVKLHYSWLYTTFLFNHRHYLFLLIKDRSAGPPGFFHVLHILRVIRIVKVSWTVSLHLVSRRVYVKFAFINYEFKLLSHFYPHCFTLETLEISVIDTFYSVWPWVSGEWPNYLDLVWWP